MQQLTDLPNVGPVLAKNLKQIGIDTPDQLRTLGAKETFLRIRLLADDGACLHMLYGIQGAIEGVPDKFLEPATKEDLKKFYKAL